jgi:hypothetical protein
MPGAPLRPLTEKAAIWRDFLSFCATEHPATPETDARRPLNRTIREGTGVQRRSLSN